MTIEEIIEQRNIEDIVHFTTNSGLTGILASKGILSRARLTEDQYLEHIALYNCNDRTRDKDWLDYVNLSITTVNMKFFGISRNKWHPGIDGWWCILSFSPEILSHSGVYFATTNNIYTSVKRKPGAEGLNSLFADKVERWSGNVASRSHDLPLNQPTCGQAEVLYPQKLSTKYLKHIYFNNEEDLVAAESIISVFRGLPEFKGLPEFDCQIKSELFFR